MSSTPGMTEFGIPDHFQELFRTRSQERVDRMVDPQPASSPVAAVVTVGTANNYSTPPAASQPGGANTIDALDNRISGMSFFNAGSIYASVNTNGGSGTPAFVLFQVQPFVDSSG